MRRYLAGALLVLMVTQSSGAAIAAGTPGFPGTRWSWIAAIDPIRSLISGSKIYAEFTGSIDRYDAMHAPVRVAHRPTNPLDAALIMRSLRPLRPHIRHGVLRREQMPSRSELDPRHRRLDPLAMRRSTVKPQTDVLQPLAVFLPPGSSSSISRQPQTSRAGGLHHGNGVKHLTSSTATTGIEHWWTYEERAIPGIGKAMLNVGTGNLVVAATDVDIHEQGIDLAFQRVYNMQSLHDANGDDGGDPAIFGNRWTNNFDANIVYNSAANTITVYDLDGTACTYTSNNGNWVPCTGEYATLAPTDPTDCTYAWTKTDGTVYWFHADAVGPQCTIQQAERGHIAQIFGRNLNNNITLNYYYYQNEYGGSESISEIDATHSDGHTLVMKFGVLGTSLNELATITRPDGAVLQYSYDTSGNLLEVDKPGNNSANSIPANPNTNIIVPQGDAPETYAYATGTSSMDLACGPRCTVAMWNNPNTPGDGAALLFTVNNLQLTSWQVDGVLNFTPSDNSGQILQSGYSTNFTTWYTAYFVYGAGQEDGCTGSSGTTTMCDTDGHSSIWTLDPSDRVTETQGLTGDPSSGVPWVVTSRTWDNSNDLTSTTDANSNVTQYGYVNGNAVEVQQPSVTDIQNGSYSPVSYYSYDSNNNVTSYCDPVYNQTNGNTWNPNPTASMCPSSGGGIAVFTFVSTDPNEPFGCLTAMRKPGGYRTTISYWEGTGTCGVGLPATVQGATITQYDQSTISPVQDLAYDGYGNLSTYDKGTGTHGPLDSWTLTYDPDNTLTQRTNNDAVIAGAITSMSCYYPDGSLFYTETPSQWGADSSPPCPSTSALLAGPVSPPPHADAFYYDTDGDQVEGITHKGCSTAIGCYGPTSITACNSGQRANPTGTTCKYYDGLDRLVETAEPYDTRGIPIYQEPSQPYEFYGFRWMNRYIYDLSQGGGSANLTISDSTGTISLVAYGGLYKTQECLHGSTKLVSLSSQYNGYTSCTFDDIRGASFDGLDRTVGKYELAYGTTAVTLNTYDCSGQYDLLCKTVNGVNQKTTYTYDNMARVQQVAFSGTAPLADGPRTYTFDADGRTASIQGNSMGTLSYIYDVDGNKMSAAEPSGESPASLICYNYYGDGSREYLSIGKLNAACGSIPSQGLPSDGGISQQNLMSYKYRTDGMLLNQQVNWNGNQETFAWDYTPSEREQSETDPVDTESAALPPYYTTYTSFSKKTYQYDSYGRVSQLILPEGYEESTFVYDGDDELVSYKASDGGNGGFTRQLTLDARGEVLEDIGQLATYSANGTQLGDGNSGAGQNAVQQAPNGLQFDVRSGMITAITDPFWAQSQGEQTGAFVYTYDGAGRQTTATQYSAWPQPQPTAPAYGQTYDNENHIAKTGNVTNFCVPWATSCYNMYTATAQWGPDGHQRIVTGPGQLTAHWDGDTLLFATGAGSTGAFLYIGKEGIMDSSGNIYVSDRDQTGQEQASHGVVSNIYPYWNGEIWTNGVWYNSWTLGSMRNVFLAKGGPLGGIGAQIPGSCGWTSSGTTYKCPTFLPTFTMQRSDGYNMVGGYVQGVRTYDSTSGQWLSPDAYAGDVHDPASQKPFMYNNGNPVEWSDPSGYSVLLTGPDPALGRMLAKGALFLIGVISPAAVKSAQISIAGEKAANWAVNTEGVNAKLQHISSDLFRGGEQEVPGGTAGAIREELRTGDPTAGSFHLEKGAVELRGLRDLLQGNDLTTGERNAADAVYKDLKDAFGDKDPEQFVGNNKPPQVTPENKP